MVERFTPITSTLVEWSVTFDAKHTAVDVRDEPDEGRHATRVRVCVSPRRNRGAMSSVASAANCLKNAFRDFIRYSGIRLYEKPMLFKEFS
jgi:hypothetical protein